MGALTPRSSIAALLLASSAFAQAPDAPDDAPRALQTVVTGIRTARPVVEAPSTVTVISKKELERSPYQTVDNIVRTVPSVATFRRSSSLTADPSSQGVNLRGLGPSAISRTLVLLDGLPVNDPFGGWVYWRALPKLSLQRIEVAPGGSSAQYGSSALGGVIQLFTRAPEERAIDASGSAGTLDTEDGAVRGAFRAGAVRLVAEADMLHSGGYVPVAPSQRGAVDLAAESRSVTGDARLQVDLSERVQLRLRARGFDESQSGGTALTTSNVWTHQFGVGSAINLEDFGQVEVDLFSGGQRFAQQRARISPGRGAEQLSALQDTPSSDLGGAASWSSPILWAGGRHAVVAGADARQVQGEAREFFATGERRSGGSQTLAGVFVQDLYRPTAKLDVLGALRLDHWASGNGSRMVTLGSTSKVGGELSRVTLERTTPFPSTSELQLSPRLGVRYQLADAVAVRANVYRAFRAPTLNELYRPFQVGTVVTASNPELQSEHVNGGELGVELMPLKALHARVVGFYNALERPVVNATLPEPLADGATRQRQNLGGARIPGVDVEAEWRPYRPLSLIAGYEYVSPTVSSNPSAPELVGKELPQDPRHRAVFQLGYEDARYLTATAQLRWVGPQFEDDLNTLPMPGYVLADLYLSRDLAYGLSVYGAIENLFDREYLVGRAGVDTVGAPRTFRLGLRFKAF